MMGPDEEDQSCISCTAEAVEAAMARALPAQMSQVTLTLAVAVVLAEVLALMTGRQWLNALLVTNSSS